MVHTSHTRLSFNRNERLKSRKLIEQLFRRKSFVQDPNLRIFYNETQLDTGYPAQFAFSVPKKHFPRAVDRNRIKRLLRECVRHIKPAFYAALKDQRKQLVLLLSFQGKSIPELAEVRHSVSNLLEQLQREKR